jgi:hypothetical protein
MVEGVVFLICTERSGSNLLRAMMNAHPSIHAPMPVHLGLNYWATIHRYGDLGKDENWSTLIRHVCNHLSRTLGKLDVTITEAELFESVKERNFKAIYEYVYTKGMKQTGKIRLFIKDNHCHKQLYYFLYYFPEAKFVIQVRDPRDYVLSCKKLTHYNNFFKAIDVWEAEQNAALEILHVLPRDKVFVQKYEDLLICPEKVLRDLCSFLELPFESQMLEFYGTKDSQRAAARSVYWENLSKPIISSNHGKFKSGLNRIHLYFIEHSLGELMDRFGYSRTGKDSRFARATVALLRKSRLLRLLSFAWWTIRSPRGRDVLPDRIRFYALKLAHLLGRQTKANLTVMDIDKLEKKVCYSYDRGQERVTAAKQKGAALKTGTSPGGACPAIDLHNDAQRKIS